MKGDEKSSRSARLGGTAAEAAYRGLKEAILSAALAPGERLTEEQVATRFAISRTPVRQAILRLLEEGLLENSGGEGICVYELNLRDLQNISETREMIDGYSAFLAAQRISEQELAALRIVHERLAQYVENGEVANYGSANARFHELIAESTHNPRMQAIARSLSDIMCLYLASAPLERHRAIVAEHQRLLEAIALRDPGGAQAAAVEHARKGYQGYLERSRLFQVQP